MAEPKHLVLVDGPAATPEWVSLVERIVPQTLMRLAVLHIAPPHCEVSITLVNNAQIQKLNRQYRGIDAPTDVLSFSQLEGTGPTVRDFPVDHPVPLGDIVISIPRMRAQAVEYGHSATRELGFLLVHGLLHLLGYDHETPEEAQKMRATEEDILAAASLSRESDQEPGGSI